MRIWKYILVMMVFMVTMSPCGHADLHSDHAHDHDLQIELCSVSSEPCECHAHNSGPCVDDIDLDAPERGSSGMVDIPEPQVTIASYSQNSSVITKPVLQTSGTLAALKTVQLLI